MDLYFDLKYHRRENLKTQATEFSLLGLETNVKQGIKYYIILYCIIQLDTNAYASI